MIKADIRYLIVSNRSEYNRKEKQNHSYISFYSIPIIIIIKKYKHYISFYIIIIIIIRIQQTTSSSFARCAPHFGRTPNAAPAYSHRDAPHCWVDTKALLARCAKKRGSSNQPDAPIPANLARCAPTLRRDAKHGPKLLQPAAPKNSSISPEMPPIAREDVKMRQGSARDAWLRAACNSQLCQRYHP